ncbi:deoxynucleotidyltransferase terminal-interacting protein 2 isoform X1 [Nothobranchius furzeri]|uniref:Deoxynucleotidyltransferase, terminal, interacting protein 2 n=1 Tax=Nothobranchius furzeri TaxID=105023 RepID=A0A8C6Q5S8_NOTFU|nr:transcript variant X1 [Nothobranchius furzeri]
MVATRRGACVNSSNTTNQEEPLAAQATPSTGRRTRSTAKQVECPSQQTLGESCREHEQKEGLPEAPVSSKKRCTRASRLHSPEQPSTPVGSVHEADLSDVESVYSLVFNSELPVTRTRGRRLTQERHQENEEISEVESCSSVVSASKSAQRATRSTRRKTASQSSDVKTDMVPETASCSSAASTSQRVTRSQGKTALTRSVKQQNVESELSEDESCNSSISRRVSTRQIRAAPIHLDELSESPHSPQIHRRTRAARAQAAAPADVSKALSCDSEGFESGPCYSLSPFKKIRSRSSGGKLVDSDSEVSSPCSTRSRGTPCSSRAGSGTSSRGAPASRRSAKRSVVVVEESAMDSSLNTSMLESTMVGDDAECTLLEEDQIEPPSSEVDINNVNEEVTSIPEDSYHAGISASIFVSEPAAITKDQKEEPSAEDENRDASEKEMMQEAVPPSEHPQPSQAATATICERASEMTEEVGEKLEAAAGTGLDVEQEADGTLTTDAQQVADICEVQAEGQTSNQQHTISEDSEQQAQDAHRTKPISLLDSSDDDDDDDEFDEERESEMSEEEEEKKTLPHKLEAASSSVDGLFMIDTRPGQDADEQYYRGEEEEASNKRTEQEEEEEEFVDEEGDDDDDEDTNILLSCRSSHMKELSSRIDPGIRVKELGGLYISFDGSKSKPVSSSLQKLKEKKNHDEFYLQVMKKSVIGPDFEKKDAVPPYRESKNALKLKHRAEREKSTGDGWFNMKAPELTQELKGDLQVLKMRGSLDRKRFYKKNDRDGFPKYFQIGTVVDNPADFYHSRIPKKERKRTMVEELLADAEFRHKNKKKYQQIMAERAAHGAGKRNKKKNKFHKK